MEAPFTGDIPHLLLCSGVALGGRFLLLVGSGSKSPPRSGPPLDPRGMDPARDSPGPPAERGHQQQEQQEQQEKAQPACAEEEGAHGPGRRSRSFPSALLCRVCAALAFFSPPPSFRPLVPLALPFFALLARSPFLKRSASAPRPRFGFTSA